MINGNQPPCSTLVTLAEKKARSTNRNSPAPAKTIQSGFFHRTRTTTKNRIVSIANVPVTAMPYAEARPVEEPKPTTSATTAMKIPS